MATWMILQFFWQGRENLFSQVLKKSIFVTLLCHTQQLLLMQHDVKNYDDDINVKVSDADDADADADYNVKDADDDYERE